MHTLNDTRTVDNTLALYGVRRRSRRYLVVRGIIRALAFALLVAVILLGPRAIMSTVSPHVTPCTTEDSVNCYWNADIQGNGEGRSFTDINGTVHYW